MEIFVTHLTRMYGGHICVAGIGPDDRHVRPVVEGGQLRKELAAAYGGPFELGAFVDIGPTRARPSPPETEDHVFDPVNVRPIGVVGPADFWGFLEEQANGALAEIFGPALQRDGNTASMEVGTGDASLGIYAPRGRVRIDQSFGKLRFEAADPDLGSLSLPVTDLRLYDFEARAIDQRGVDLLEDRIRRRRPLLSVGVGRPWAPGDREPRHWLQVNNVHLDDAPLWRGAE